MPAMTTKSMTDCLQNTAAAQVPAARDVPRTAVRPGGH